jgi:hypothetical protein
MTPERTPEGKWILYRADGQRFDRWSVDAQLMLATGGYTADPPNGSVSLTATVAPGSATTAPEAPEAPADAPVETPAAPTPEAEAPRRSRRSR